MIIIDGSKGGGQMLRTALALGALTGKPFRMSNIRASRDDPGLKPQHLACVKAAAKICNGYVEGAELGNKEILFIPKNLASKSIEIDIGTAGSITLLLQAVLLPSMFGHKAHTITVIGGTDVPWSMPVDYFKNVILPQYSRVCDIEMKVPKRGYYPKGGGKVEIKIKPKFSLKKCGSFDELLKLLSCKAFNLTKQGNLLTIKGVSHASLDLMNAKVAERTASSAKQKLEKLNVNTNISIEYTAASCTGSGITLWAPFALIEDDLDPFNPIRVGADTLGEKGKSAEEVGKECAKKLLSEMLAPVDTHLADNIIPLLAVCRPSSIVVNSSTDHMLTNIEVVKAFLGDCIKVCDKKIFTTALPA